MQTKLRLCNFSKVVSPLTYTLKCSVHRLLSLCLLAALLIKFRTRQSDIIPIIALLALKSCVSSPSKKSLVLVKSSCTCCMSVHIKNFHAKLSDDSSGSVEQERITFNKCNSNWQQATPESRQMSTGQKGCVLCVPRPHRPALHDGNALC